jgi:molybdenum cofactor biosynthesis enzyme MoaA
MNDEFSIKTPQEKKSQGIYPYITYPLTSLCNSRCSFCGKGGELTARDQETFFDIDILIDRSLTAMKNGIHKFRLTGGEPFKHPDIGNILKFFSDKKAYTLINTNGTLITEHKHDFIELNDNIHVAVSLHTTIEQTYNKIMGTKRNFHKVIEGIEYLAKVGNLLRLNMVITKSNEDHLDGMIAYCKDLGCGLKVHEIVAVPAPFGDRKSQLVPILPIERELAKRATQILPHEYSTAFGIPCKRYVVDGVVINVKSLGHGSRYDLEGLCNDCSYNPCHEGLYDCYVLPSGNILPCRWGDSFSSDMPFAKQLEKAIEIFQQASYVSHNQLEEQ